MCEEHCRAQMIVSHKPYKLLMLWNNCYGLVVSIQAQGTHPVFSSLIIPDPSILKWLFWTKLFMVLGLPQVKMTHLFGHKKQPTFELTLAWGIPLPLCPLLKEILDFVPHQQGFLLWHCWSNHWKPLEGRTSPLVTVGWVIWKGGGMSTSVNSGFLVLVLPFWHWSCMACTGIGSPCLPYWGGVPQGKIGQRSLRSSSNDLLHGLAPSCTTLSFQPQFLFDVFSRKPAPKRLSFLFHMTLSPNLD